MEGERNGRRNIYRQKDTTHTVLPNTNHRLLRREMNCREREMNMTARSGRLKRRSGKELASHLLSDS